MRKLFVVLLILCSVTSYSQTQAQKNRIDELYLKVRENQFSAVSELISLTEKSTNFNAYICYENLNFFRLHKKIYVFTIKKENFHEVLKGKILEKLMLFQVTRYDSDLYLVQFIENKNE